MAAAKLDANAWYLVSETRVINVSQEIDINLQTTNQGLRVFPLQPQAWQFHPIGDIDGRYLARLNTSGVRDQLSVCWSADEVHPSGTIGCMRTTESDESQQWDISEWGDGSFKFTNVANGSRYALDVHPGSNLFMSSEVEGTDGASTRQPAQHWVMSSERPVDDGAYSTIYTAGTSPASTVPSTATSARVTTSTTPTGSATDPASSEPESSPSDGGITPGAAAGIGVGVSLASVALILAGLFFWWRRRQAKRREAIPSTDQEHYQLDQDGPAMAKLNPATVHATTASWHAPAHDYYGQEAKMLGHTQPHSHAAEAAHNPIHEAPSENRYELDNSRVLPGQEPAQLPTNQPKH